MKIGDVAEQLNVPASTIRYYEKIGLIDPQPRVSGHRIFNDRAVFALEFIRMAQASGFTIEEIKLLLEAYKDNQGKDGDWVNLVAQKQREIRQKMTALAQMDGVLSELLSCNCTSIIECVEIGMTREQANSDAVD